MGQVRAMKVTQATTGTPQLNSLERRCLSGFFLPLRGTGPHPPPPLFLPFVSACGPDPHPPPPDILAEEERINFN